MDNERKIKHIFAAGNTGKGFVSFFDEYFSRARKVFIIKGGPGTGKSTLMHSVGMTMIEKGYDVEFVHCSSDSNSLDGIYINQLDIAMVDGTSPHVVEPRNPGVCEEYINLGELWNSDNLEKHSDEIKRLTAQISHCFKSAYKELAKGKDLHDQLEAYYIRAMDFEALDQKTNELIEKIFGTKPQVRDLFASGITPQGTVNYMNNLTEDMQKRYIIKGRAGTGKSTLLKKVAEVAIARGLNVDRYHCSFDPDSLDMVIIPSLKIALLDGTAPHIIDAQYESDEIINVLECADMSWIEASWDKISEIEKSYSQAVAEGIDYIKSAKSLHDILEDYYQAAMDFTKMDDIKNKVLKHIHKFES